MHIIYSNNGKYAPAAVSVRDGEKTSIRCTCLGTVIDKEKGYYRNSRRGLFSFDGTTGEYGSVPESEVPPTDEKKYRSYSLDFGDVYLVNAFLHKSGMMNVIDNIEYGNPDTLHAMVLFYILSALPVCSASVWYEGSIVRLLYPKAKMSGRRIRDFLKSIGTREKQFYFQTSFTNFAAGRYDKSGCILIDSGGSENGIRLPVTAVNTYNGAAGNEVRLVFAVQKNTGIPLYYKAVPGNIVDPGELIRIFLHLEKLGVSIDTCIMDAGYNTGSDLDLYYDENHRCRIRYITRVRGNDKQFAEMIREELDSIDQKENLVRYDDRYLFIKKKMIYTGSGNDNPAWMYLGVELTRLGDADFKQWKKVYKNKMSPEEVFDTLRDIGIFGIISGYDYECEEILPAYYQRQAALPVFDLTKNYAKLFPPESHTEETFYGNLLLAYIASCSVKIMRRFLKCSDRIPNPSLEYMRNQKCVFEDNHQVVIDQPQREAEKLYKALGIACPSSIPVLDGVLQYTPPMNEPRKINDTNGCGPVPQAKRSRGRPRGTKNKLAPERERPQAQRTDNSPE